ncbi:MAG: primase protein [Candidatus Gottesmanbacteria bacterium GW2011_GWC2_39_8]|uniref:DNA primase n=1 Tax=Candidatus Gottesmanbacteria bacterium GW2011_GWC2_39_8 TaxID=1618450 RepID=A0A0G0Q817_9BACT|nr:MAG: primase protein [Candidatus Gottesmanbacteria bacterium GW2011_GWC2_39_8]
MNDLELIKSKIDIVNFLSEYITIKKAGRNFKANCPFHHEKTPSFVVSPERQSWHCFGACGEGGDIFDFLMKWENLEFSESIKILAQRAGIELTQYQPSEPVKLKEKFFAINRLAGEFYHYILTSHNLGKKALEYLKERYVRKETVETFKIGYSPNSWDALYKFLTKKGYSRDDIYNAGFLVKSDRGGVYDRFRGRLMFTLYDHRGNPVGFSGRKMPPDTEKEAKYINSPETPVYIKGNTLFGLNITKEAIKKEDEAILVEGEFDMLSSWQSGVGNIVAIKGSALTEGQINLLKRYTTNITMSLDSDLAGNAAAMRGIELADAAGFNIKVVKLLYGKDPDECVQKDASLWKKSVKEALPVYDFVINSSFEKNDPGSALGKKKISEEVVPFLAKISNSILVSHYVKLFAKKLDVSEEAVYSQIGKQKKTENVGNKRVEEKPSVRNRQELLEEHILSLVLQSPNPKLNTEEIFSKLTGSDFHEIPVRKILEELVSFFAAHDTLDIKNFAEKINKEFLSTFDRCYLKEIGTSMEDGEIFDRDFKKSVRDMLVFSLKRKINENSTKLSGSDSKDDEEVEKLRIETQKLIGELQTASEEV